MNYLKDPYTRLKIISNIISSILYIASTAVIWLQFKKSIPTDTLITIDNVWAPIFVFGLTLLCNKYRENIINKVWFITIIYGISMIFVDTCLFIRNEFSVSNYILQTITDVSVLNIYCYSFNGFNSKVFDKADSQQKFGQWMSPISTIAVLFGGCLGVILSDMSLRFLISVQICYDLIWFFIQLKIIAIGKEKIESGNLL
jgi:hypothetical protein